MFTIFFSLVEYWLWGRSLSIIHCTLQLFYIYIFYVWYKLKFIFKHKKEENVLEHETSPRVGLCAESQLGDFDPSKDDYYSKESQRAHAW